MEGSPWWDGSTTADDSEDKRPKGTRLRGLWWVECKRLLIWVDCFTSAPCMVLLDFVRQVVQVP